MTMLRKLFCISLLLLFNVSVAQNNRPKIGVVLSGGGAKGLAHIGVLKVLEEKGIPIDYIGGSSMGAIIGGLYASGYTAYELDSIFKQVDTEALLRDYIPRISKSFREKRNDEIYAIQLPFENFKISTPSALSKGMYNYNLLSGLLSHVRHEKDFTKLPIPFLCIATDLESGSKVVLNKGNLVQSILASGAFPTLYNPMEIDGKVLIDGGVSDNYPIEEVRKMGADIIIGVDVQDGLKPLDEIFSLSDVLFQINNFSMVTHMNEKIKDTDVYIQPKVKNYSVVSFNEGDEIIKLGEKAAHQVNNLLEILCHINDKQTSKKSSFKPKEKLLLSAIEINPIQDYTKGYVLGKLRLKPMKLITYEDFFSGIDNLNASQNFHSISYEFKKDSLIDSADILHLTLKENTIRRQLKFGLHYDGLYKSALLVNLTQRKTLFKNDLLSVDVAFGDEFRYNLDYYIDNGIYWNFGISSKLSRFNRNISRVNQLNFTKKMTLPPTFNIDYTDLTNRIFFQTFFQNKFLLGVGLEHKYNNIDVFNDLPIDRSLGTQNYFSAIGHIIYDTYDNKYFPKKGFVFRSEFKHLLWAERKTSNFFQLEAEFGKVFPLSKRISFEIKANAAISSTENIPLFLNYFFGGQGFETVPNIKPFYGYNFLNIFTPTYAKALFHLDYEIFKKNHLNFSANFLWADKSSLLISQWLPKQTFLKGYALGYGIETLIGPLEITYSWSPENKNNYTWVSLGFRF